MMQGWCNCRTASYPTIQCAHGVKTDFEVFCAIVLDEICHLSQICHIIPRVWDVYIMKAFSRILSQLGLAGICQLSPSGCAHAPHMDKRPGLGLQKALLTPAKCTLVWSGAYRIDCIQLQAKMSCGLPLRPCITPDSTLQNM